MSQSEVDCPCVGVCMTDPDSGYCLGCGRPPLSASPLGERVADRILRSPVVSAASEFAVPVDAVRRGS